MRAGLRLPLIGLIACFGAPGMALNEAASASARNMEHHDPAIRARALETRGREEEAAGAYAKAERHYRQALHLLTPRYGARHPRTAEILFDLAHSLDAQGREGEGEPLYRQALSIALEAHGERDAIVSVYYSGLASNLDSQGDHAPAEAFHRKAVAIDTQLFGASGEATMIATVLLARNLIWQKRDIEAVPLFEAAVRAFSASGGDPLNLVRSQQGLAIAFDHLGRHGEAEPLHRDAMRVALERLGKRHPDVASIYQHLADNLAAQGRRAEAEAFFRRDLEIARATSHQRNAPLAASLSALAAHMAHDRKTRREALGLARKAVAMARSRRAHDHLGKVMGRRAAVDERARTRALTGVGKVQPDWRHDAFEALLIAAWLHAADAPAEREALLDEAFQAAQELGSAASGLAILAAEARQAVAGGPLADLVREQQRLAAELRELDRRLMYALAQGEGREADALRAEASAGAEALARIEATLRSRFPAYFDLISPSAVGIAHVRERLGADEALLLVLPVGDDVFSFAVNRHRASWHRIAGGKRMVAARVDRLRCQVDPVTCGDPEAADGEDAESPFQALGYYGFDGAAAFGLYDDLIAPLAATIGGARRLYVTVSGPLADLPLGLLLTRPIAGGQDDADPAVLLAANWFADTHAIIRLPTVSAFRAAKLAAARGHAATAFVGYGAPRLADFVPGMRGGRSGDMLALARGKAISRGLAPSDVELLRTLPSLPGTERELHAMSGVLQASTDALYLGAAATEGSVRANAALGQARVLAFATHGLLPNDLSGLDEPGLVFTPPDAPGPDDDGVLTASEASELKLNADWVILSACNTASPAGATGPASLSSLARAFLYAGTRALLASHWRVADDATAALTVETLATVAANPKLTRAEAFQRAQRTVRTGVREDGSRLDRWDDSWAHPSAWAPLSLISDRDE